MKVVHVATIDEGGAYNALVRIHNSMKQQKIDSSIILRTKTNRKSEGISCVTGVKSIFSKCKNLYNNLFSNADMHIDLLGTSITNNHFIKDADIIILHWVNSFFSMRSLEQLKLLNKPIIWVLHDMWALTGGCHYSSECEKYSLGCINCSLKKKFLSTSRIRKIAKQKKKFYEDAEVVFVTPSNWLGECVKKSWLTQGRQVFCIHNPIDILKYRNYHEGNVFSSDYNVPENKRVILYGASNAISDSRKGFEFLKKSLRHSGLNDCVLAIFGNSKDDIIPESIGNIKVISLGTIRDFEKLVSLYYRADVFVAPSVHENYSNAVLEALCCGTPVVAFNVGGMPDLIEHKKNGYLAEFPNESELADGIEYCIEHYANMTEYAKMKVKRENSYDIIGNQYKRLCEQLMNKHHVESM